MRCPVRCLRAIMHDPSKCLKACLRFLTPLAVTPLPPPPGILDGISTLTFTKNLWARSSHQVASPPCCPTGRAGASSALGCRFEPCHRHILCHVIRSLWFCSKYPVLVYSIHQRTINDLLTIPQLGCPYSTNLRTRADHQIASPMCCPAGRAGASDTLDYGFEPCYRQTFCRVVHPPWFYDADAVLACSAVLAYSTNLVAWDHLLICCLTVQACASNAPSHRFQSCCRQTPCRAKLSLWLCAEHAIRLYNTALRTHDGTQVASPTCCPIGRASASSTLGHRFEPCRRLSLCCCAAALLHCCCCTQVLVTNLWSPASYFSCSKAPSSLGGSGPNPQGDCPIQAIDADRPASQHEEMAAGTTAASRWGEWRTRKLQALRP